MDKLPRKRQIVALCRENRKNPTPAEQVAWEMLRNRRLDNKKFLRQHKILFGYALHHYGFVIVDFYCAEEKLAVEIDGNIHDYTREYDAERTKLLEELGMRVLRIRNEELCDIEAVKSKIRAAFLKHRSIKNRIYALPPVISRLEMKKLAGEMEKGLPGYGKNSPPAPLFKKRGGRCLKLSAVELNRSHHEKSLPAKAERLFITGLPLGNAFYASSSVLRRLLSL